MDEKFTWEPNNKGKILSFPQWEKRVNCLLGYYDILKEDNGRQVTAYKNDNKNLHHWLRKFSAKIDKDGKKRLYAKKAPKTKMNMDL